MMPTALFAEGRTGTSSVQQQEEFVLWKALLWLNHILLLSLYLQMWYYEWHEKREQEYLETAISEDATKPPPEPRLQPVCRWLGDCWKDQHPFRLATTAMVPCSVLFPLLRWGQVVIILFFSPLKCQMGRFQRENVREDKPSQAYLCSWGLGIRSHR